MDGCGTVTEVQDQICATAAQTWSRRRRRRRRKECEKKQNALKGLKLDSPIQFCFLTEATLLHYFVKCYRAALSALKNSTCIIGGGED